MQEQNNVCAHQKLFLTQTWWVDYFGLFNKTGHLESLELRGGHNLKKGLLNIFPVVVKLMNEFLTSIPKICLYNTNEHLLLTGLGELHPESPGREADPAAGSGQESSR